MFNVVDIDNSIINELKDKSVEAFVKAVRHLSDTLHDEGVKQQAYSDAQAVSRAAREQADKLAAALDAMGAEVKPDIEEVMVSTLDDSGLGYRIRDKRTYTDIVTEIF
jgi:hypothetical protein